MKPGPIIAMVLLVVAALGLTLGPAVYRWRHHTPGAASFDLNYGADQVVEAERLPAGAPGGDPSIVGPQYRLLTSPTPSPWMSAEEFALAVGDRADAMTSRPLLLRMLKVSSWFGVVWFLVGLGGQLMFFGRMLVQWVTAERSGQVVVPASFWWMSMIGGIMLFVYFVWRQEMIGALGQSTGIVIYARNLRLIGKQNRRRATAERRAAAASASGTMAPASSE